MREWQLASLGEVAQITKGRLLTTSSAYSESSVRYLGATDLEGRISGLYASADDAITSDHQDVLMLWDGERSGFVGYGLSGAVGSTVARIRPRGTKVASKYLYHHLRSRFAEIQSLRTGTGVPHVPRDLRSLIWVPVPPLEEQHRIAEVLDTIDETIQVTERVIAKLRRTEAAVLMESIDFRHNGVRLGDVCSLLQDGTHLPPPRKSEGPLLLSVQNLDDGQLRPSTRDTHVSEAFWQSTRRALPIRPGDVCLAVVGATLGKLGVVPPDLPLFTVQRSLTVLRADPTHMRTDYLFAVMRHVEFQRELWRRANQTAQPGVYLGELREILVPSPPLDEQRKVTELLASISEAIHANVDQRAKLQRLRSGLDADLLSGRVRTVEA